MKSFNDELIWLYQIEGDHGIRKSTKRQGVTVPLALDCVSSSHHFTSQRLFKNTMLYGGGRLP